MNRKDAPDSFPFGQKIVWQPNRDWIAQSNLQQFMDLHGIANYDILLQRANADVAWFWKAALTHLDIRFETPFEQVVDFSDGLEFPRWCVGGRMNIIQNCLDKWQSTELRDAIAFRYESESGKQVIWTYAELHQQVCRCAAAMRKIGLGKGDAVGLYMPMIPELLVAFLATIKIGGVILPLFSGYGPTAIVTRLRDAGAKALFTVDGAWRRGRPVLMKATADEALPQVSSIEYVVVTQCTGDAHTPMQAGRDLWWPDFLTAISEAEATDTAGAAATTVMDAEDILMIIYTSGTTGRPKGAVHTHCGFPVKSAQDMFHSMDVKQGDTLYWMSDMGWMMGPWEVFGTLLIGATLVFFDGAPDYPDVDRLWQLVEAHNITHLGLSPTLIRSLRTHGADPVSKHDVSCLRAICSTGSPWDPESWMWLFDTVLKREKPILNYSGGTEISGGIVCGNFFKPLKPAAFSGPVVGMDADVVDEQGQPLRGAVGELVIRQPWIGMTRGFWNDRERYLDSYWRRMPGLWVHGDFAAIDADGLWYILGRSDDTIKVAGKRLGPAEVEAILNAHPAVAESAAIAVPHAVKDNEVVGFCVLKAQTDPSEVLRDGLMAEVVRELGKPLKPRTILFTTALPKTRNAKVMRRVIRAVYLGEDAGDMSSLENPDTLEAIRNAI